VKFGLKICIITIKTNKHKTSNKFANSSTSLKADCCLFDSCFALHLPSPFWGKDQPLMASSCPQIQRQLDWTRFRWVTARGPSTFTTCTPLTAVVNPGMDRLLRLTGGRLAKSGGSSDGGRCENNIFGVRHVGEWQLDLVLIACSPFDRARHWSWWSRRGWGGCLGWIKSIRGVGSAGDGEKYKNRNREGWSMWKLMQQSTVLPSNRIIYGPHRWRRGCGCFWGRRGCKRPIRSNGTMGRSDSRAKFAWERGGETQHRPHNNQPLTLIFGTVVASRVVAIVPGLLLLYCGWEASLEATEISWLRCLSLGRGGGGVSLTKINVPRFKWGISRWRSVTSFPHVMTKNVPGYISRSVLAAGCVPGLSSSCFGRKSTFVPGDSSRFLAFLFWRVIVPSHWAWPRFLYLGTSEFGGWRAVYYPICT
jgi:hypothetical protein